MTVRGVTRRALLPALVLLLALVAVPASQARPEARPDARRLPLSIDYVALGDSYTSGPLVLPFDDTFVPIDCGQSLVNYPHLVAKAIGAESFTDMSCGSATLDDLFAPQTGLTLDGVNRPQLDPVGPGTDLITLGMGGNDVNFTGLALDCVRLLGPPYEAPCTPVLDPDGADKMDRRIRELGVELGHALDAIEARAPDARILVVGYPAAMPANGVACWPYLPILPDDMPYLVAKFTSMNRVLARTARAHGHEYVDLYTSSIGHDACQVPLLAWINGIVVVPPSYPAHPNNLGLADAGKVVTRAVLRR